MTKKESPGRDQRTGGDSANTTRVKEPSTVDDTSLAKTDPAAFRFVRTLITLGVAVWVASPGVRTEEFHPPMGWQKMTGEGNHDRIARFQAGMALCANTGSVVAVVDVDPRNGGDVVKVRDLLATLGVRIFAEIATPGGGRHFYIAGHPALPMVHDGSRRDLASTRARSRPGLGPGLDAGQVGGNRVA
jgi:hypothetical protein